MGPSEELVPARLANIRGRRILGRSAHHRHSPYLHDRLGNYLTADCDGPLNVDRHFLSWSKENRPLLAIGLERPCHPCLRHLRNEHRSAVEPAGTKIGECLICLPERVARRARNNAHVMPAQTTRPPLRTAFSARGTRSPTVAKMIAASRSSGGLSSDPPAPSSRSGWPATPSPSSKFVRLKPRCVESCVSNDTDIAPLKNPNIRRKCANPDLEPLKGLSYRH